MIKEKEIIELLDGMLSALIKLFEEKGVLKYEEREKIKESEKLNKF